MNWSRDLMALAGLAHRRYPNERIDFAMMMFQSDRRRAGLGALDTRHRHGRHISNVKERRYTGEVCYTLSINAPARQQYKRPPMWKLGQPAPATIQLETVPARQGRICYVVQDLGTQRERDAAAHTLLEARKQLRRETHSRH